MSTDETKFKIPSRQFSRGDKIVLKGLKIETPSLSNQVILNQVQVSVANPGLLEGWFDDMIPCNTVQGWPEDFPASGNVTMTNKPEAMTEQFPSSVSPEEPPPKVSPEEELSDDPSLGVVDVPDELEEETLPQEVAGYTDSSQATDVRSEVNRVSGDVSHKGVSDAFDEESKSVVDTANWMETIR
jgi:hypothetical protein